MESSALQKLKQLASPSVLDGTESAMFWAVEKIEQLIQNEINIEDIVKLAIRDELPMVDRLLRETGLRPNLFVKKDKLKIRN